MPIATPQGTLDFKSVDKVTFVGASSNTVIDTTTGSLGVGVGVGGPTSNLHVVGNTRLEGDINMLHTSNTASIKLNSNVVTEFPRSKKLIKYPRVALTYDAQSNQGGYENYIVDQSSVFTSESSHGAYKSFRGNEHWLSSLNSFDGGDDVFNNTNGPWISIQLPTKIKLEYLEFYAASNRLGQIITAGSVYASNNGSTWINIGSLDNLGTYTNIVPARVDFTHTTLYDRYLLHITANETTYVHMEKLSLFGVPEYDPEADGTDVTVKSYPNVPNTDWLEVYYDAKGLTGISSGVSDLSGNSINGVVTGATLSTDENIDVFNFDGQNDIIQGTFSGHTLSSGYTMATWIKPGVIGADDYIATFGVGSNGTSFGINFQTAEGAFRAFIWGSSTPGIVAQTNNGVVTKDKWVHVAATFISGDGTIHLYIDNKLTAIGTGTALSSISASAPLVLGARNSGGTIERHANFKMANFRLFNRALTSDEIYQLYAYQKEYFGHGDLSMTLKAGRLGIGTSEPRAMLDVRGDFYAPGSVVQIQTSVYTAVTSTSDTTWKDISSNFGVTITPKFANSNFLIQAMIHQGGVNSADGRFTFYRIGRYVNDTLIEVGNGDTGNTSGIGTACTAAHNWGAGGASEAQTYNIGIANVNIVYVDQPNTTSPITYRIRWNSNPGGNGTRTAYINRVDLHSDGYRPNTISTLVITEIAQ